MFIIAFVSAAAMCVLLGYRLGYRRGYEEGIHGAARMFANNATPSARVEQQSTVELSAVA